MLISGTRKYGMTRMEAIRSGLMPFTIATMTDANSVDLA